MDVLVAQRGRGGLGEPRRDADPQSPGDEFQQRPAAGLIQIVEPARKLPRHFGLAKRTKGDDDLGQRRWRRVVVVESIMMSIAFVIPPSLSLPHKGGGNGSTWPGGEGKGRVRTCCSRRRRCAR